VAGSEAAVVVGLVAAGVVFAFFFGFAFGFAGAVV
jgi:hypothetical protein